MWVANRSNTKKPILRQLPVLVLATAVACSCVYFNALYNANDLFDRGRSEIAQGNTSTGRSLLARSIEKAEKIVAEHPDSRWADDAQRLIAEARLLREEWEEAATAAERLLQLAGSRPDSAAAAAYLGSAAVELGDHARAESLLTRALAVVEDPDRRAEMLFQRGRARARLGDLAGADADLEAASRLRPDWSDPRLERLRVLVAQGRPDEAESEFGHVLAQRYNTTREGAIVELVREVTRPRPEIGVQLLQDVESSQLRRSAGAELVVLRGQLRLAITDTAAAIADFETTLDLARGSAAAVQAYLGLARVGLRRASRVEDLAGIRSLLTRATTIPVGAGLLEIRRLLNVARKIGFWVERGGLGYLLAAESARDELGALTLARQLFLEYADRNAEDLWAAKAILAALALTPVDSATNGDGLTYEPSGAELRRRLVEDYRDSAYVEALLGGNSSEFTYEELENGLQQQLERLRLLADQQLQAGTATGTNR